MKTLLFVLLLLATIKSNGQTSFYVPKTAYKPDTIACKILVSDTLLAYRMGGELGVGKMHSVWLVDGFYTYGRDWIIQFLNKDKEPFKRYLPITAIKFP